MESETSKRPLDVKRTCCAQIKYRSPPILSTYKKKRLNFLCFKNISLTQNVHRNVQVDESDNRNG